MCKIRCRRKRTSQETTDNTVGSVEMNQLEDGNVQNDTDHSAYNVPDVHTPHYGNTKHMDSKHLMVCFDINAIVCLFNSRRTFTIGYIQKTVALLDRMQNWAKSTMSMFLSTSD